MNKGIVMGKNERTLIVMTGEGQFREIARKKRSCRVGEEIAFSPSETVNRDRLTLWSVLTSLVTAILICVGLFGGYSHLGDPAVWFAGRNAVAYVSLDINPSVEIGIDKMEQVKTLSSLNDEGAALIQGVEYKGKTLSELVVTLLSRAEGEYLSSGKGDIVIGATTVKESRLVDTRLTDELTSTVQAYVEKNHSNDAENFQVAAIAASPELREAAKKTNLSTGKYAAYLSAKNNGYAVTVDQFKTQSLLKLAEEAGDLETFIKAKELTKESLDALLQEEKSGELDRKLKDKRENLEPTGATGTPSPEATEATRPTASPSSKPDHAVPSKTPQPDRTSGTVRPSKSPSHKADPTNGKTSPHSPGSKSTPQTSEPPGTGTSSTSPGLRQPPSPPMASPTLARTAVNRTTKRPLEATTAPAARARIASPTRAASRRTAARGMGAKTRVKAGTDKETATTAPGSASPKSLLRSQGQRIGGGMKHGGWKA
jgi:hypothetical protein